MRLDFPTMHASLLSQSASCVAVFFLTVLYLSNSIIARGDRFEDHTRARSNSNGLVNSLGGYSGAHFCDLTPLSIERSEYEKRCGPNSDPKWPCFTHLRGDLRYATIEPWLEPLNVTKEILVKDDQGIGESLSLHLRVRWLSPQTAQTDRPNSFLTDFTLRNASDTFSIEYRNYRRLFFRYYGYDPATGCYNIHLSNENSDSSAYRIWASDDVGDDRDVDTLHYHETGKRLCSSKWIHIHLDADSISLKHHYSDNSGI